MKSVYLGKISTGTFWSQRAGFGGRAGRADGRAGGVCLLYKIMVNFWLLGTRKSKTVYISRVFESVVKRESLCEWVGHFSVNPGRGKCCLHFFFLKRRAPSVCRMGSVQHGELKWWAVPFFMKKEKMCSVIAWETKHFSPVEYFSNTCCLHYLILMTMI